MATTARPVPDASGIYPGHPALGRPVSTLPTPVALVDLPILEHNIRTMAAFFDGRPASLRPHAKTHRTPVIAHMQRAAGATGVTTPKTSTAEAMVAGGIDDVFVANQVVSPPVISRLASLAARATVSVLADDPGNVTDLSDAATAAGSTLHVLVEVDAGMGRCGTQSIDATRALAGQIVRAAGLRFAGLHAYEGHVVQHEARDVRSTATIAMLERTMEHADALRRAGIDVRTMTCGGTGTYDISGVYPGVTEHQAGSYVYMDPGYVQKVPGFGLAFSVLTTVLSTPSRHKVVLDGGLQVLSSSGLGPATVKGQPELVTHGLSEEHGIWTSVGGAPTGLAIGDQVEVYPYHCCAAANLHDTVYAVRDGLVEGVWAITARGCSQ